MEDKVIPIIKAKKNSRKDVILDPNGFFIINLINNQIRVEYYKNCYKNNKIVSGILDLVFIGFKADALSDTIAKNIKNLRREHYMYLGRELQKAEICLEKNKKYIQGGC
jgi:hypothetical protein